MVHEYFLTEATKLTVQEQKTLLTLQRGNFSLSYNKSQTVLSTLRVMLKKK